MCFASLTLLFGSSKNEDRFTKISKGFTLDNLNNTRIYLVSQEFILWHSPAHRMAIPQSFVASHYPSQPKLVERSESRASVGIESRTNRLGSISVGIRDRFYIRLTYPLFSFCFSLESKKKIVFILVSFVEFY